MKKVLLSSALGAALLVGGFSTTGIATPSKAEAAGFEVQLTRSGYITNYVTSKGYSGKYDSRVKTFSLTNGYIKSNSSVDGSYKVYIQTRKNSKSSWKTVKTITATKNGTTHFTSPKIPNGYSYRFYTVNAGTKKKVNFFMSWIPFAN
ncbi:hypothetical protein [Priestia aryabhattai]|uniref:hypothetical protein n=1 Tax=Priestia aryabhattai TaxID=412384 RepID=UPI001C8E4EAE|nr:hypothetical protein [Priestia aryabhattai]MBX9998178.1 hypothetical protein [Priestia aryabhattai]